MDLFFRRPGENVLRKIPEYVSALRELMQNYYDEARKALRKSAAKTRSRVVQNHYQPGSLVYKRFYNHKKTRRIQQSMKVPYVVKKVVGDCLHLMADKRKTYLSRFELPYISTEITKLVQQ